MNLECQTFDGTLDVICIKGGPITDVEHEEMEQIIRDSKRDAALNGIQTNIQLKKVSYLEFLREYDSESLAAKIGSQPNELEPEPENDSVDINHGSVEDRHGDNAQPNTNARKGEGDVVGTGEPDVYTQLVEMRALLMAKDKQLVSKDKQLALQVEELEQMRAQLKRLEGVPPEHDAD